MSILLIIVLSVCGLFALLPLLIVSFNWVKSYNTRYDQELIFSDGGDSRYRIFYTDKHEVKIEEKPAYKLSEFNFFKDKFSYSQKQSQLDDHLIIGSIGYDRSKKTQKLSGDITNPMNIKIPNVDDIKSSLYTLEWELDDIAEPIIDTSKSSWIDTFKIEPPTNPYIYASNLERRRRLFASSLKHNISVFRCTGDINETPLSGSVSSNVWNKIGTNQSFESIHIFGSDPKEEKNKMFLPITTFGQMRSSKDPRNKSKNK